MSEFGEYWERKIRTAFYRLDVDGDGVVSQQDFELIAEKVIKVGQFTGSRADEIRDNYLELWNKYFKRDGDEGTVEAFLLNFKNHGKSDLALVVTEQYGLFFDAVDNNNDGLIQLQEFINYYDALGINEEIAKKSFQGLDTNRDGVLSRDEFVTAAKDFSILEEPRFPADLLFGPLI